MATLLQRVSCLAAVPVSALLLAQPDSGPRFYPDDPIAKVPPPVAVHDPKERKLDPLFDFAYQSARPYPRPPERALGVNTLGEVPDSAWYTNRHGRRRMTREELRRGPGDSHPPQPPFRVVSAKTEGITPGFQMRDASGRLYFVKFDPATNPEMATAADVIGSRFFYALGYNTPENYLVRLRPSDLTIDPKGTVEGASGRERRLKQRDLNIVFEKSARSRDGSLRVVASLALAGKPIGPFQYEGTRPDDPNDLVPHERRRDLRGLYVFAAWLNHTDAKAQNSLDTVVEEQGVRYIRHHLIDFGAILGSASDMPKPARYGNGYIIPEPREAWRRIVSFGLFPRGWESAHYPGWPAVGRFEAETFDPETWKSNYPNPAFLSRLADDEYWAARQVMAFTDDDIRAIVETGEYSDPRVTDYIVRTLAARRDKIGRVYLNKVLALDHFRVEDGELKFDDLAARYGVATPVYHRVSWARYDNDSRRRVPLFGGSLRLPPDWSDAPAGSYFAATLAAPGPEEKRVTVYLRKTARSADVAGIERMVGQALSPAYVARSPE